MLRNGCWRLCSLLLLHVRGNARAAPPVWVRGSAAGAGSQLIWPPPAQLNKRLQAALVADLLQEQACPAPDGGGAAAGAPCS